MVPVPVRALKLVTHGLPLVPPVYPPQSNRSWVALCREVGLTQVTRTASPTGRHPADRGRHRTVCAFAAFPAGTEAPAPAGRQAFWTGSSNRALRHRQHADGLPPVPTSSR